MFQLWRGLGAFGFKAGSLHGVGESEIAAIVNGVAQGANLRRYTIMNWTLGMSGRAAIRFSIELEVDGKVTNAAATNRSFVEAVRMATISAFANVEKAAVPGTAK